MDEILNVEKYAVEPIENVYAALGCDGKAMTSEQVGKNRERFGANLLERESHQGWLYLLLRAFGNPFNLVLGVLIVFSFFTGDLLGVSIIAVMILLSVGIKFVQEVRSQKTSSSLHRLISSKSLVFRYVSQIPELARISSEEIVVGDIIQISAGDIVPADVRIISSRSLVVNQSVLSGESLPVEKNALIPQELPPSAFELANICFMGTSVVLGAATAVVVAVGTQTVMGQMVKSINRKPQLTPFDIGINRISWLLIKIMLVVSPLVFLITGFTKGDWFQALIFGLSVAVGLTPEMLPVVVTTNLARGAARMSQKKVIVRNLNSIQDLGAMDVLCTDKTGTLTENRIVLIQSIDVNGNDSPLVLEYSFLNSYYQRGMRNMLDEAIVNAEPPADRPEILNAYKMYEELPFDFERRRMSVIVQRENQLLLICKGALEEMLQVITVVEKGGVFFAPGENDLSSIRRMVADFNKDGLRVLAVAYKVIKYEEAEHFSVEDESELILKGFVTFLDPPKQSARQALDLLRENHIKVKVLTGDNEVIAHKICKDVGFADNQVMTGPEIAQLTDEQLAENLRLHSVYARLTPLQKERIVEVLRKNNHIVGYLGDGINDAPALKRADVGITVDSAVDVARENSDFILLEPDLTILNAGVEEGRKTYANAIKYIKCTASSNLGNILGLVGASALFPFLPMLPIQILILNLIYDTTQASLPWDNVDKEFLKKPHRWQVGDIRRFILIMGPIATIFDYYMFFVLYRILGADTVAQQSVFQTGWFLESLFTQTMIIHLLRTRHIPFLQSCASPQVLISTFLFFALGWLLPYTFVGKQLLMYPMHWSFYPWLILDVSGYCLVVLLVKKWYISRFGKWL